MSKVSSVFSLGNIIRLMIFIGLLAVFVVIVQSCQSPKTGIDRYGVKSLRALTVLDNAPLQPSLEFNSPSGKTMTLSDYHGKVVLLNAWATWCPPCVAEMPSLNRLQNLRGGDDFQVVTISLDNKKAEITEFFERNNIDALPDWHDGTYAINGRLRLPGLPTTVLYDRQGRELARLSGEAEWDSDEALALVDYLLAQ